MNQKHSKLGIPMTAERYANEWEQTSAEFSSAAHYAWMAEQLGSAQRVLELGCGVGYGTLAMAALGKRIVAIDSNLHCITAAQGKLLNKGVSAEFVVLEPGIEADLSTAPGVALLQADLFSDNWLISFSVGSFDAIVCWMMGTHPEHISQHISAPVQEFNGSEMALYRKMVQQRVYGIGTRLLTTSGFVHLVDRAKIGSWADKDEMRQALAEEQAKLAGSGYLVSKHDCILRKLPRGLGTSKIQWVSDLPAGFGGIFVLTSSRARIRGSGS
jgi:hypothetical protein